MESSDGCAAAKRLLEEVAVLLKDPRLAFDFARRGLNTSLALVAVQGTISYLEGEKLRAAEDLATAAEEIRARSE
jgi:hypothetical protein